MELTPDRRLKEAVSVFNDTKRRIVPEMPLVVWYTAAIGTVKQRLRPDGDVVFETSYEPIGTALRGGTYSHGKEWEEVSLDAFGIRDEFLKATTKRRALDFLRETGQFLPHGVDISWSRFQLWRDFAEQVDERETLSTILDNQILRLPTDHLDPTGKLAQMLLMLTGLYEHNYFGPPAPPLNQDALDTFKHTAEVNNSTPEGATKDYAAILADVKSGGRRIAQRQRELEEWFREPPPNAYSIEWIPEPHDPELHRKMAHGGAMIEFMRTRSKLVPILVIRPQCTLTAIAAAIYAERVAAVQVKRCPGCKARIEVAGQRGKLYCSDKCKFKLQKRRQRRGAVGNLSA